jgi:hypothetical protein
MTRIRRGAGYTSLPHCLRTFAISPTKLDLGLCNTTTEPLETAIAQLLTVNPTLPITSTYPFTQYAEAFRLLSIWNLSNAL